LLGIEQGRLIGQKIKTLSVETHALFLKAKEQPEKITQAEVSITQKDNVKRLFLVRIAIETIHIEDSEKNVGAIVTFDDITDLQSAQRKAAWADVARRIAHEIKNPLTPIQLSAERLKRKYLKDIKTDPDTFEQCTDTIIRHVEDIGEMVNEFSAFARMPEPVLAEQNIIPILQESILLHHNAHNHIVIHSDFIMGADEHDEILVNVDAKQMRQAFNNIIQNAIDSMMDKYGDSDGGVLRIFVVAHKKKIFILLLDNGAGFPENATSDQLTEPYVTHKDKGTGVGLAIVKKIMEDHDGEIILGMPEGLKDHNKIVDVIKKTEGACVCLVLPHNV